MARPKYIPCKEHKHLQRICNPHSKAVHLQRDDELDDETLCGHVIPEDWVQLGPHGMFTCQNCLHARSQGDGADYDGPDDNDPEDALLDLAQTIAGDESDGVFWGIYHELGGFGT